MDDQERANFTPRSCPDCGAPGRVTWLDQSSEADSRPDWAPGRTYCTNRACPNSRSGLPPA